MLDHLIDYDPPVIDPRDALDFDDATPGQITAAQLATADWLQSVGAPTADDAQAQVAASLAQSAFTAVATVAADSDQRAALAQLKTPEAVRHLTGMLTAYDWAFVEQAKEIRGYAVSQILEETKNPDPRIRLRALELLGKVTEVALFTERTEVRTVEMSDKDLEARIKDKLNRFMGVADVVEVVDAEPKAS